MRGVNRLDRLRAAWRPRSAAYREVDAVRLATIKGSTTASPASSTRAVLRHATATRERVPLEPRHSEA